MDLTFIIAITTMGGLGFLFAGGLAFADKKLRVEENPLIGQINELLPGANCGGCGKAGCYDFSVNVVDGTIAPSACPVGGVDVSISIALLLGVDAGDSVKMIPRILCRGGNNEAVSKAVDYIGPNTCRSASIVSGGNKLCYDGCLGGGDCVDACKFNAMIMNDNELPEVLESVCNGCGNCAKACPRGIIEMHPVDREVFIFCKNTDDPKRAKEVCSVACIGCGICARKSDGAIEMINNLGVIDYQKLNPSLIPFEKCSTNAIAKISKEIIVN